MIALWMVYSTIIALMLGAAAAIADRAGGTVFRQRRWIWAAAILLSVAMPAVVAFMPRAEPVGNETPGVRQQGLQPGAAGEPSAFAARVADLIAVADSRSLAQWDRAFAIGWVAVAGLALAAYLVATWTLARRRRTWRAAVVDGERVLLARGVGPAVIGAVRPEIVVPEWSLDLAPEQRALMIEHERQHVRARDPLVLHAAALVALLTPWNVALWWLNRRLRLAVELDCDARVLAGGRDVRAYGTLLLDVCARRTRPSAVLAPALLERTSSLSKRILAMHPAPIRFARSRILLGATASVALVALACDMPTPEMLAPDGKNAAPKRLYGQATPTVNGPEATKQLISRYFPDVARGEGESPIMFVVRSSTGEIVLTATQPVSALARIRASRSSEMRAEAEPRGGGRMRLAQGGSALRPTNREGARAGVPAGISAINPDDIASVDVVKHAAGAVAPNATSLITITLRAGASVPASAGRD
jgi:beta-lactamase regulating signal transducer with metallopeptidase domain